MIKYATAPLAKILLFLICLVFINSIELAADSAAFGLPPHFYKRFEGTINNQYKIILHLTKHNETLSGYYYYTSQSIPLFLNGSGDAAGNFTIEESTHNGEVTGQFSGKFTDINHMSGTWRSADKKKQFSFELKESYSQDYAQCTTYELIDSCPLFDDAESPKIEIFLFYIYPIKYRNQNILTQLQQYILPDSVDNPQKKLESMRDSYVTAYKEENRDIYEPDSLWMFMWEHSYGTSLVLNDKEMFTCRFYFYDYMGGAHGLSGDGFMSIDMSTGKKLKPEDIFVADYEEQLGGIMDKKLRAQEEIPPEAALQDHDFFVDRIQPNDNFYVALDGIGFYFNVYEIRPYAFGATDIFLSFKEIKHLIKADSPLRRLFE